MLSEKALVIFSGGQDSTTCLLKAIHDYGRENVETISFNYGQRHAIELEKAKWIAADRGVNQILIDTTVIGQITHNALMDDKQTIKPAESGQYPNTFVDGRNALFLLLAATHAKQKKIKNIITGVCETDFSGYPDCRDIFIKSMNVTLNLALDYSFNIITPLMYLTKAQTFEMADKLGYLDYILNYTHTCYMGVEGGCKTCPSCLLRKKGLLQYLASKANNSAYDKQNR